jgi:thioredoxin 1
VSLVAEVTTSAFMREVMTADRPALVDFYVEWCGPCHAQMPILEGIARTAGQDARVVKVNVDRSPELAELLEVRALPTLLIFRSGRITDCFTGVTAGQKIAAALIAQLD